jgi:hypothetical protein
MREGKRRVERGHILNIAGDFTHGIILMVTPSTILSISMPHHCTIYFFQSHYNILCNVIGIYRWKFFLVYSWMNCTVSLIMSITMFVKTYTSSHCLDFFIHFILIVIPSSYTDDILLSIFADRFSDGTIKSVNITVIYRQKKYVGVYVCIC